MSDKNRLPNPTLTLARQLAAARLKRAGVKPSHEWSQDPAQRPGDEEQSFPPELIERLAG
jgi:hypothetical protein